MRWKGPFQETRNLSTCVRFISCPPRCLFSQPSPKVSWLLGVKSPARQLLRTVAGVVTPESPDITGHFPDGHLGRGYGLSLPEQFG